jgi:hypothetical protein
VEIENGGTITNSPKMPLMVLTYLGGNLYEIYGEHGREIVEMIDKEEEE